MCILRRTVCVQYGTPSVHYKNVEFISALHLRGVYILDHLLETVILLKLDVLYSVGCIAKPLGRTINEIKIVKYRRFLHSSLLDSK